MGPLRKTLITLSAAAILLPVLCGIASGQNPLTTIQDTLFNADGARYNGTLVIRWSTFDTQNPGTIIQQSKSVQVVNGNLLVQLAPNNTAQPPANLYNVFYHSDGNQQYTETWTVTPSSTPLKVAQVRTGGGVGGGGGGDGSAGGLTGAAESTITNLVSDLNARPIKGPGYGTGAVAVVNQSGQIETVVGNLGDCVFVDGTTGPCTAGLTLPSFVNGEAPSGQINGLNATFTLANSPATSSLLLFRNGLLLKAGVDYTLNGSTVQFAAASIPQPNDTLSAQYRVDPGTGITDPGLAIGPSGAPGANGCGAAAISSKSAAYQIVPADNGALLIQTANAGFSLPVTVPSAGWCVALLDTNNANVTVNSSGNHINGVSANYVLGSANTAYVVSDGSGYWVSAAAGGASAVFPSGTGAVIVSGGTASLVTGAATNCVEVNGSSTPCGSQPGGANGQIQFNNNGVFGGFAPAVNGNAVSTPSTLNFLNSSSFNGLQFTFSNPTGGNVQLGATGTLNNAGLTNSSFTASVPSWLSSTTPVALGGTLTLSAAGGQAPHQVIGTCGTAASFAPCSLQPGDIPTLNQNTTGSAANVTGVVARANGGLNSATPGTGLLRDGATPTASELSGDATTSGTNAVTVAKVNGVSYSAAPANNTVPVVTSSNTVTYQAVPNAALANSSVTVNGQAAALGASTNVNNGAAAHTVALNQGAGSAITGAAAGTVHQVFCSNGSSSDPAFCDSRDVKIIPFAAAPSGAAGAGVSYASGQWTATARAGTNNIGGALQATPSTGAGLQWRMELPLDWDPAAQPYIRIEYGSGSNTSGTVIWTVSSACTKADGSVSDDPAFNAESAFSSQTMAAANRAWSQTGHFTLVTSGNNCVPGGGIVIRAALSGTAAATVNAYQAVVTIPTLPNAGQAE
ncbi:MAG TPA: hypothetical protein VGM43_12720 [Bryobacteraceae bacterium]|jgi:hypothetical protein